MTNEAIILAGGLGTRLSAVVKDLPKPMAPINTRPFLAYLLDYLESFGINRVILSVGYKHEAITDYFATQYKSIELVYAVENEPLGTGGGIANALKYAQSEEAFLLNGDTFFNVNLNDLAQFHAENKAELSLSLKPMSDFDRYGSVITTNGRITNFAEKQFLKEGLINGGVYLLNKTLLLNNDLPLKFSFENDILEKLVASHSFYGKAFTNYFIDIGVPDDYKRAQEELDTITAGGFGK